jgi:5-methylcytosine-specific restriction endonuclease McrA
MFITIDTKRRMLECSKCGALDRNTFGQCRPCKRIANAKHRAKTRAQASERTKRWNESNPEKKRAYSALYRQRHPEKARAAVAKALKVWRARNAEKLARDNARWYAEHPEARRLKQHNRKIRTRGRISKGIVEKLLILQKGKCVACRDLLSRTGYHIDHIISVARGGANEDWNIQLLCPHCNVQKHTKHPVKFMQEKGFLL